MPRIAILCGTGMENLAELISDGSSDIESITIETNWGNVPILATHSPHGQAFIIDRHHSENDARVPPHSIEHRANVHAAASTNPELIISVNSVGAIDPIFPPGLIGLGSDVIDLAIRPWTFFNNDAIHSDRTTIFWNEAQDCCDKVLSRIQGVPTSRLIVAQCIGPQFETPSEIDALEKLGASVVGMTLGPESRLVSETGLRHISLCCSSNWASGRDPSDPEALVSHSDVEEYAASISKNIAACVSSLFSWLDSK